jgi:DNA repair ATPase RecN
MRIDVTEIVGGIQQNVSSLVDAARSAPQLLDLLRDTHRVLLKLENMMDRLDDTAQNLEKKFSMIDLSPARIERLEKAIFNIERATAGVEATMGALPRVLRTRIDRLRPQTAGDPSTGPQTPLD